MEAGDARPDVPARVEQLLCDDADVEFAVLFGSRATGTPRSTSDLDVAIKFADALSDGQRFRKRCHLSGRLQGNDVPFVDLSDLEELPIEAANAAVAGEFLCGDEDAYRAFKTRIETAYDEHRDEIERQHRDTISRIASGGLRG